MSISIIRLLVDFGLLVLIWMVQLIIYPSFLYYSSENLQLWHAKYTPLIGYIVAPLMFLQLGIYVYQSITAPEIINFLCLGMVLTLWVLTFLIFVPLHGAISEGNGSKEILISLVNKNWYRTVLWTILLFISLFSFLKK